jgi:hypothetical protein
MLIGLFSAHNNQHGFQSDGPRFIGHEGRARMVYNGGTDKPGIGMHRLKSDVEEAVGGTVELMLKRAG